MNLKKFILFLSLFIILFSIGSLSANENITNIENEIFSDTYENEINTNEITSEESSPNDANISTSIEINNSEIYYSSGIPLKGKLIDANGSVIINQNVIITINGQDYTRGTNNDGIFSLTVNLAPKAYDVSVEFKGTNIYKNSTATSIFTVISTINGDNITKYYRNATQYYAEFLKVDGSPLTNTDVTFNINGVFYTRKTNGNGVAQLNINLNSGTYTLTAIHPTSLLNYSNTIKVLALVSANDLTKYYLNGSQYTVQLFDNTGNKLSNTQFRMNINGVFYTKTTDANGYATLAINLFPDVYIITVEHPDGYNFSNTIDVKSRINTHDQNKEYGELFAVEVFDVHGTRLPGETIEININGVLYQRVSDEYGFARLLIRLYPGTYIATTSYMGYSVSNTVVSTWTG